MEKINGQELKPFYNFYTITINKDNNIKDNFFIELETLTKKVKSKKQGIWLKIDESI